MSDVYAALDAMQARLRALRGMAVEVAREAAPLVEGVVRASAAAGTTVEGEPWPTRRDGSRALPDAANAVTAAAVGTTIVVSLKGPYVFHNSAEGKDRRRILPEEGRGVPPAIAKVLTKAGETVFARRAAGAR